MQNKYIRLMTVTSILALGMGGLTACGDNTAAEGGEQSTQQMPAAEVSVYAVQPQSIELSNILPGRVAAYKTAEIRPQVSGIVQKRLFEQGAEVTEGQVLYQIDPAPFEAERKIAEAAVKRAEATLTRTRVQAKRLKPLIAAEAISGQAYDDAVAEQRQAEADILEARATLERKELDLKFAAIDSPINGRIDQAIKTEGALVTTTDTNPMATVQQINQVFVDVKQPASRLEHVRQAVADGHDNQGAEVTILSSDNKPYDVKGKLLFSGISVDPTTGEVLTRVLVPNENYALLPGMYVQAELPLKKIDNALMVPQQTVKHTPDGKAHIIVVDDAGNATTTDVTVGEIQNGWYIVTSGLKAGDKVVVEGQDRVMPQVPVKPVEWKNPAAKAVQ